MRRQALTKAMERIIKDLEVCEISSLFQSLMEESRGGGSRDSGLSKVPFSIFQKYMVATNDYDKDLQSVCSILEISPLLTPEYWEKIATNDDPNPVGTLYSMYQNIRFTLNQLPKVLELTKQHYISEIKEESVELPEALKGKALLTVLLTENDGHFSTPKRLSSTLGAITDLYEVISIIDKESKDE